MKDYLVNIGIEVHAELDVKTKAFCGCQNKFGSMPNTFVCPMCMGLPGAIANLNKKAVEKTIQAGILFGASISNRFSFERKNYFYPDLPKGYQLVEYSNPIAYGGRVVLSSGKEIKLNRIHLEEDTGRLVHSEEENKSYIDFNRSGVALLEIVSEPCEISIDEVIECLRTIRKSLIFSGISLCKKEHGGFRFDINISVKNKNEKNLGVRVELKNLTSSSDIRNAIEYEIDRQVAIMSSGEVVKQETRVWDAENNKTYVIRPKENVNDYRHIQEPDIKVIEINNSDITRLKESLPESYTSRLSRYKELGLSEEYIDILTSDIDISNFFDDTMLIISDPEEIIHWITTELLRVFKDQNKTNFESIITPENMATIIQLLKNDKISRTNAKQLFDQVVLTGISATKLAKELEIIGEVGEEEVREVIMEVVSQNPDVYESYKSCTEEIENFFIGNVIKITNGRANVDLIKIILADVINKNAK